jgi:ech hydrogenase subunit C
MGYLSKSPWIIHYDGSSCNGCDIEVLACLTPLYDVERFGIINTGNPKHADILLITGSINEQNKEVVQNLYAQMPDPKVVVAIGICAATGGIFSQCYNVSGGVSGFIPVDIYVPGCAARPETIIDGVVESLKVLELKYKKLVKMARRLEEIKIELAGIEDAVQILTLQKMAYQSEAEIYNDYSLSPLQQTLEGIKEDFNDHVFYKVVYGETVIGSVRAFEKDKVCYVSRLVVDPLYQNLGIGRQLMNKIEKHFCTAEKYEIFAGHKSRRNIYFHEKNGYSVVRKEQVSMSRQRLYMQKINKDTKNA